MSGVQYEKNKLLPLTIHLEKTLHFPSDEKHSLTALDAKMLHHLVMKQHFELILDVTSPIKILSNNLSYDCILISTYINTYN